MRLCDRTGEIRTMNCGEEAEIIKYINYKNIFIKFLKTGEVVKCEYGKFKIGEVKSCMTPTVFDVGVIGIRKKIWD